MPELPEVEVLRRIIDKELKGATAIQAKNPLDIQPLTILATERVGKALGLRCPTGYVVFRLGLTGDLFVMPAGKWPSGPARVSIPFNNGKVLHFVDSRGFGKVLVSKHMPVMGPDVMQEESYVEELAYRLSGTTVDIKTALLDQSIIAGVGNAYAADALWDAGINPFAPACTLTRVQVGVLVYKLRSIMAAAIEKKSRTDAEVYHLVGGWKGVGHPMKVYRQEGRPCPRCGTSIRRTEQGGRSTYFCPKCQKVGDT